MPQLKTPKNISFSPDKTPKQEPIKGEGIWSMTPSWRFCKADVDHDRWSICAGAEKDLIDDECAEGGTSITFSPTGHVCREILKHLISRESMTWGEIMQQSGGRSKGTNSHAIPISSLNRKAQDRINHLKIVNDSIFSLRIGGIKRIFGFINPSDGSMDILWYDRDHSVCKSKKKHT
ncbi:MAG: hypothetical protein ACK5M3_14675 [Dysgonomonas sp.]